MIKSVFLAYIHEEEELAMKIKQAIEMEFSGFVEVFVSSDGKPLPAGSNFLKNIESALVNCHVGLFLISPRSIKRNWVNFELGAAWIRKKINMRKGGLGIPVISLCHSGMLVSDLPQPVSSLNAVQTNIPKQWEFVFKSIQTAINYKGTLKTDFNVLASLVTGFEKRYTLGECLKEVFRIADVDVLQLFNDLDKKPACKNLKIEFKKVESRKIDQFKSYENNELKGYLAVIRKNEGLSGLDSAFVKSGDIDLMLDMKLLHEFRDFLLK